MVILVVKPKMVKPVPRPPPSTSQLLDVSKKRAKKDAKMDKKAAAKAAKQHAAEEEDEEDMEVLENQFSFFILPPFYLD